MTITSVRLMFATDNRATPFALRGYFMNIFTMKKYKAYILKYVPYISKQMACIFRHF